MNCKSGQTKTEYRGELEVCVAYTVRPITRRDSYKSLSYGKSKYQGSSHSLNKVNYSASEKIKQTKTFKRSFSSVKTKMEGLAKGDTDVKHNSDGRNGSKSLPRQIRLSCSVSNEEKINKYTPTLKRETKSERFS